MYSHADSVHHIIEHRRSIGILVEPAPSKDQLMTALEMAKFAPDHRHLKPTHFIVIEQHERSQFADILVKSLQHDDNAHDITPAQVERIHQQVQRAPMIVLAFTKIKHDDKVPEFEQLLSTGAAVQNVLLSLEAQGFATIWRTGNWVNSVYLKQYFGFSEQDYLSAMIYIGTPARTLAPRHAEEYPDFIQSIQQFHQDK